MQKSKTTSGDWWFRIAALVTIFWIGFLFALTAYRYADYWPLFEPKAIPNDVSSTRLTLNEIGDFLAGSFAPLAFLWFFISTWLQREELKETRQVLADQQEELKRAAQESAEQTKIMQRQLETAKSREIYEEHRLRLYYLAKYVFNNQRTAFSYRADNQDKTQPLFAAISNFQVEQTDESVDRVLARLGYTIRSIPQIAPNAPINGAEPFRRALTYIQHELKHLVSDERYTNNLLVWGRISGADLLTIYEDVEAAAKSLGLQ
jgi:hypothetical protein